MGSALGGGNLGFFEGFCKEYDQGIKGYYRHFGFGISGSGFRGLGLEGFQGDAFTEASLIDCVNMQCT